MVLFLLLDTTVTAGAKDIASTPPVKEQNLKAEKDSKNVKLYTQNKTLFSNVRILNILRKLISP
jgi:hypothetical protein